MSNPKLSVSQRIREKTPSFFVKLRNIGLGLIAAGTSVLALNFELAEWVPEAAKYLIVIGTVMAGVAQTTTTKASE